MSDATALPPDGEPRRSRPQQNKGFAQSVAFSAARGTLLIGVAVVIGIVLLQVVDNDTTGPIGDGGANGGAVVDDSSTSTTPQDTTTTTVAAGGGARQPAEISVQVLNGSGVAGAAAAMTEQLGTSGYVMIEPTDTSSASGTTVYCTGGLDREASALAAAVGGDPPPSAEALPDPPPSGADSTANCVVVIGS
ncbi:MAG: LytR C-terminal domain-containing protein [Acidimicrobiia bacterium]